jgi:hypothetical protein
MKIDNLPCSLESIGDSAFFGCSELHLIVPGKTKVGTGAFHGCDNVHFSPDNAGVQTQVDAQPRTEDAQVLKTIHFSATTVGCGTVMMIMIAAFFITRTYFPK